AEASFFIVPFLLEAAAIRLRSFTESPARHPHIVYLYSRGFIHLPFTSNPSHLGTSFPESSPPHLQRIIVGLTVG
ncbi:hypothetical protein M2G98_20605, partial [Vibrio vulnificus]|nr:hypothetical protein [Vibrio vulnificus]